jgi:hypothetical protein
MNVIRHEHISANADAEVTRSSTIFDERSVNFLLGE